MDNVVDRMKDEAFIVLVKSMNEHPETTRQALDALLVARNLERVADHATNIAEDVIFWVRGADVRHNVTPEQPEHQEVTDTIKVLPCDTVGQSASKSGQRPVGAPDSSPAIYRWVSIRADSVLGTAEPSPHTSQIHFRRASGTRIILIPPPLKWRATI